MIQDVAGTLEAMNRQLLAIKFVNSLDDIALAWQMKNDVLAQDIPRVLSFPCEPLEDLIPRLITVLRTETENTENHKPGMSEDIERFAEIVAVGDHPQYWTAMFINFLHAKQTGHAETGRTYHDMARMYPQYANSWTKMLVEQYGRSQLSRAIHRHPELLQILKETKSAANSFYAKRGDPLIFGASTLIQLELIDACKQPPVKDGWHFWISLRSLTSSAA